MSHFEVNKKLVGEIMNSPSFTSDQERDSNLLKLYISGKFKGGSEMMKKTVEWFIETYPKRCVSFELFLRLE